MQREISQRRAVPRDNAKLSVRHIALVARQLAVDGTTEHNPHECSPIGFSSQTPDGATRRLWHGHSHSRRDLDASC